MRASIVFIFAFILLMFFDTLWSAGLMVSYSVSVFSVVTLLSFNTSDPILLKDSGSLFIFLVCCYNGTDNLSQNSCSKRAALITINLFYVLGVIPLSEINIGLLIPFLQACASFWRKPCLLSHKTNPILLSTIAKTVCVIEP